MESVSILWLPKKQKKKQKQQIQKRNERTNLTKPLENELFGEIFSTFSYLFISNGILLFYNLTPKKNNKLEQVH